MKFIQPVSMVCTEEQYETFLKEPLLKMGYKEIDLTYWDVHPLLVTNSNNVSGDIGNIVLRYKSNHHRYYIETFNPDLFLAVAAMSTEEYGIPGEYWTLNPDHPSNKLLTEYFTPGKIYRALLTLDNAGALINNFGIPDGFHPGNLDRFRKSTLEELVSQLTIKNVEEKEETMAQKSFITTRQNMYSVWNIACVDWKPRIEELVKVYGRTFLDEVELPFDEVKKMFDAATKEQKSTLCKIFPTYLEHKNAWVGDIDRDELARISESIFGNTYAMELANPAASDIGRPDLRRRAFYIEKSIDVKLHKTPQGGYVIEFIRK